MDAEQTAFIEVFREFLDRINRMPAATAQVTPLGAVVERHLGVPAGSAPVVAEQIPPHRLVDADIALDELSGGAEPVGVTGGQQRFSESLPELLSHPWVRFGVGPVDYVEAATGPATSRQVVAFGLRLFSFDGAPVAVLQRSENRQFGAETARVEVLAADPAVSGRVLAEVRRLMVERSVLRGQVLTFRAGEFGHHHSAPGADFLERPQIPEEGLVLPDGVLSRITRHVVGMREHRTELIAAGRHLKRGVLLYGPPGTGKTLTVRHLLGRSDGVTCVLLTGPAIRLITEATEIARSLQPAIVVLEDVDLIAAERDMFGPQPLLFAVLDALEGLDGDADVTFLLTTNRVELLERALVERPGRVDLAVEIPLPDPALQRRLFRYYGGDLGLSTDALDAAADRSAGTTASFAKELMRRVVLDAAEAGESVSDAFLVSALEDLLSSREALTRNLLGGGSAAQSGTHPPR